MGEPTCIVVASGLLHAPGVRPERALGELDPDAFLKLLAVNALGPALIAKHFLPLTPRQRPSLFAALSARVGSLRDNRLGGWYSYRASKAALNMLLLTLAIEQRRTRPFLTCVALHPGTVATALSAPFVRGRTLEQRFEPEQAAGQLLAVMDQLTPDDSGGFFAWDGASIPW
jgi:NAD(P)-dependent dehydrogenase (short-subunit alcohol dehydrogenase family)